MFNYAVQYSEKAATSVLLSYNSYMAVISVTRQMSGFLHMKEGFSEVQFWMTQVVYVRGDDLTKNIFAEVYDYD